MRVCLPLLQVIADSVGQANDDIRAESVRRVLRGVEGDSGGAAGEKSCGHESKGKKTRHQIQATVIIMDNAEVALRFARLTTAHVADGCLRAGVPVRCAPTGTAAVIPGTRVAGRVLPARHAGSVDVFLEALGHAEAGGVLVVDNHGRLDESCVGDLITLEARGAGLGGIVIWGLNRDTVEIREIGLPVFSLGSLPTGPLHVIDRPDDALTAARFGELTVTSADAVFGDEDGVLFVPLDRVAEVLTNAEAIRDTERRQAALIAEGTSLREQVRFDEYLASGLTFREHLRGVGGEIEV